MRSYPKIIYGFAILGAFLTSSARAQESSRSLTATMTNDAEQNAIQVYDSLTHALLQTIATGGKGGVSGNARGVRQFEGRVFAAVNNGSKTVSVFERRGNRLVLQNTLATSSAPVSIDFANQHLYVAGATTADSFLMSGDEVLWRDGSSGLELAEGKIPPAGSTAQAGALQRQLLVTLKSDPSPGTVDVIPLNESGAIEGDATAVAGPATSLTPFGFSILEGGQALITLAHSGQVGLFRDGAFGKVITSGGQAGPCWTTRIGEYILVVNAGSATISREVATGSNIFIDAPVAATIATGGAPTDVDSSDGIGAVLDHSSVSHLSFFAIDPFGNLTPDGSPIDLGVPGANGVAVMPPAPGR